MRRTVAAALVLAVLGTCARPAAAAAPDDRRLLIVSWPGLTWSEVAEHRLPALESVLDDAAIADLAPRSVRNASRPGDAYLTIAGGTRAIGDPAIDGAVVGADEDFFGEPASGVFERRTGERAGEGAVVLGWSALDRANAREPYDIAPGLLAATLDESDVATAVIGNADGSDLNVVSYERQAALALADRDGRVAGATVGTHLLADDPTRPFGVHLDRERVMSAFDEVWTGDARRAVLVEASDLARAMRYRPLVDADRYAQLRADALAASDALLAELLERTDRDRDAILVVAPYHQSGRVDLTVVALRSPVRRPGYLRSASTQRAGIVTLVDVAPTILEVFAIARPTEMEGRPFEVERSSRSLDHRIEHLVAINDASRFRERLLTPTTIALVLALALIVAAAILARVTPWSSRWSRALGTAALVDLAGLPVSYVARAFPLEDLGAAFYWSFLVVVSGGVGLLAAAIGRRAGRAGAGLALVLALDVTVLVGDVLTGSNLHLGAAFGYSPTGNSRLYGISNYSFGQLAVATLLLAALVAWWWPTRRGRIASIGMLVAVLVVLGVPIWGSDVGGIIAFTPTILVFHALLVRQRPSLRGIIAGGVATVAAVLAFGFADLARPASDRAHLGRLFERIGDEGLEPLLSIVERKLLAILRVSTSSFWLAAIPIALGCWLFLRWWRTRPLDALHRRVPTLHAALVAAVVAAVLGSLVNDSGAIVGGVACLVLATSLVHLSAELDSS